MVALLTRTLTGMSCLKEACLDSGCHQKTLRTWELLSKLMKALWRNGLVPCLVVWFLALFPDKKWRLLTWNMARINLETLWEHQGLEEYRYCKQSHMTVMWLGLCALKGWLKINLKVPCGSSSKADKGAYMIDYCSCVCANNQANWQSLWWWCRRS